MPARKKMMHPDDRPRLTSTPFGNEPMPPGQSLLSAVLAVAGVAVLLVLGFMFSLVILVVVAVVGLFGYGYVWWKTRTLRQLMREQRQQYQKTQQSAYRPGTTGDDAEGNIIEGEVIREQRNSPS